MTSTDTPLAHDFVQAKHHEPGNGTITRVVIHDEEYPVSTVSAEQVAQFFTSADTGSAHYTVDSDSIVQCVLEAEWAWHAPPNPGSIGIEHDGYAKDTAAQWLGESRPTLLRSALLVADIITRHKIPAVWLSPADLLAGKWGITSHANVSAAWHQSDHTDPGPNFPVADYLAMVHAALGAPHDPNPWAPHLFVQEHNHSDVSKLCLFDGNRLGRMIAPNMAALTAAQNTLRAQGKPAAMVDTWAITDNPHNSQQLASIPTRPWSL